MDPYIAVNVARVMNVACRDSVYSVYSVSRVARRSWFFFQKESEMCSEMTIIDRYEY